MFSSLSPQEGSWLSHKRLTSGEGCKLNSFSFVYCPFLYIFPSRFQQRIILKPEIKGASSEFTFGRFPARPSPLTPYTRAHVLFDQPTKQTKQTKTNTNQPAIKPTNQPNKQKTTLDHFWSHDTRSSLLFCNMFSVSYIFESLSGH